MCVLTRRAFSWLSFRRLSCDGHGSSVLIDLQPYVVSVDLTSFHYSSLLVYVSKTCVLCARARNPNLCRDNHGGRVVCACVRSLCLRLVLKSVWLLTFGSIQAYVHSACVCVVTNEKCLAFYFRCLFEFVPCSALGVCSAPRREQPTIRESLQEVYKLVVLMQSVSSWRFIITFRSFPKTEASSWLKTQTFSVGCRRLSSGCSFLLRSKVGPSLFRFRSWQRKWVSNSFVLHLFYIGIALVLHSSALSLRWFCIGLHLLFIGL